MTTKQNETETAQDLLNEGFSGCPDCGMAYSFYFNCQFHKTGCKNASDSLSDCLTAQKQKERGNKPLSLFGPVKVERDKIKRKLKASGFDLGILTAYKEVVRVFNIFDEREGEKDINEFFKMLRDALGVKA